jgi:hypothetical protein
MSKADMDLVYWRMRKEFHEPVIEQDSERDSYHSDFEVEPTEIDNEMLDEIRDEIRADLSDEVSLSDDAISVAAAKALIDERRANRHAQQNGSENV